MSEICSQRATGSQQDNIPCSHHCTITLDHNGTSVSNSYLIGYS